MAKHLLAPGLVILNTIRANASAVQRCRQDLIEHMDPRFNQADRRFTMLEDPFVRNEQSFERMEQNLDNLNRNVANLQNRMARFPVKISHTG